MHGHFPTFTHTSLSFSYAMGESFLKHAEGWHKDEAHSKHGPTSTQTNFSFRCALGWCKGECSMNCPRLNVNFAHQQNQSLSKYAEGER